MCNFFYHFTVPIMLFGVSKVMYISIYKSQHIHVNWSLLNVFQVNRVFNYLILVSTKVYYIFKELCGFSFLIRYLYCFSVKSEAPLSKRNIIIIGNIGAGKSHCGNRILGKQVFVSKMGFSLVTKKCTYGSCTRNGLNYQVFDTPGIDLTPKTQKEYDVKTEIRRCLMCISPGFHAIVLVLSADERLPKDFTKLFNGILEDVAYEYMIIVVSKQENNTVALDELINGHPRLKELIGKCNGRLVIFGNDQKTIPIESVEKFDDILTELINKNSYSGKEFYTDSNADDAMKILKKDQYDYMREYPNLSKEAALEKVQIIAAGGSSPREKELRESLRKGPLNIINEIKGFIFS